MRSMEIPRWVLFVLITFTFALIIFTLFVPLFQSEIEFFFYVGLIAVIITTLFYLIVLKAFVSHLLIYKNPYSIQQRQEVLIPSEKQLPFRFVDFVNRINSNSSRIFRDYLSTSENDFKQLLIGGNLIEKIIWLPLTDRKLPNFRLFFEFLNHITEENLEGYYGENLLCLCQFITNNFKSRDKDWTVKQLQKAHSGWKNCSPKRRMDLKIDIENHFVH
ncbi:hypothetical protein [Maribacter cobaltidurans]|nr:hypothetical protein [Maribacter cobaltidurans]